MLKKWNDYLINVHVLSIFSIYFEIPSPFTSLILWKNCWKGEMILSVILFGEIHSHLKLILRKYGLKVKFIILYCHFFHRPFQETLIIMRRRPTSLKRSFRHNTSSSNLWPSVGGSPLDWMYWSVSMVGNFQHILSSHCVHYKPIFSLLKHQSKLTGIKSKYKRIKYIWCTEAQHHLNIHVLTYNSWCVFRSR